MLPGGSELFFDIVLQKNNDFPSMTMWSGFLRILKNLKFSKNIEFLKKSWIFEKYWISWKIWNFEFFLFCENFKNFRSFFFQFIKWTKIIFFCKTNDYDSSFAGVFHFQAVVVLISEISQIIFFNEIFQFSRNFGGKSWIWTGSRRSWEIIHEQFVRTSVKMNPSNFQLNRVINRKSVLIF